MAFVYFRDEIIVLITELSSLLVFNPKYHKLTCFDTMFLLKRLSKVNFYRRLSEKSGCWSFVTLRRFIKNVYAFYSTIVTGSGKIGPLKLKLTTRVAWLLSLRLTVLSRSVIVVLKRTLLWRHCVTFNKYILINSFFQMFVCWNFSPYRAHFLGYHNRSLTCFDTMFLLKRQSKVNFYRRLNFPCLKFIEIVILWVYYTIPIGFTLFWHFWAYILTSLKDFLWLRITDEGLVPEMRIWSMSMYDCIRSLPFSL